MNSAFISVGSIRILRSKLLIASEYLLFHCLYFFPVFDIIIIICVYIFTIMKKWHFEM